MGRTHLAGVWPLALLGCALAMTARASDIYVCPGADGGVHFSDRAGACPGARVVPGAEAAADPPAQDPAPPPAAPDPDPSLLEAILIPASGAPRWQVVEEAVPDPARDPDLVRWGVRAQRSRHYTRPVGGGGVQVCSVELWGFASEAQAALAHGQLSHPGWTFDRVGAVLMMLRGVRRAPGEAPRWGVFPDCGALGRRTLARARARLGTSGP